MNAQELMELASKTSTKLPEYPKVHTCVDCDRAFTAHFSDVEYCWDCIWIEDVVEDEYE